MPRLRQAVAQQVADRLFAVESAIDLALTRAAELNAAMPQARTEARLQIGLKEVASGDSVPKVPGFTEGSAAEAPVAHLRAVA